MVVVYFKLAYCRHVNSTALRSELVYSHQSEVLTIHILLQVNISTSTLFLLRYILRECRTTYIAFLVEGYPMGFVNMQYSCIYGIKKGLLPKT